MSNIIDDKSIADFVRNKSICIVGRAGYLRRIQQGSVIDSHDIVVRVNNPYPYPDTDYTATAKERRVIARPIVDEFAKALSMIEVRYKQFIGIKVDVFVMVDHPLLNKLIKDKEHARSFALKLGVSDCSHFLFFNSTKIDADNLSRFGYELQELGLTEMVIDKEIYRLTRKATGSSPNGGTQAIHYFSQFDYSNLYLTGFSYKATNLMESNLQGSITTDFRYISSLVKNDDRISCDGVMEEWIKQCC